MPNKTDLSFTAVMPSNIALIKYMGKKNIANTTTQNQNIPDNVSLSYTLGHLTTTVTLSPLSSTANQDQLELEASDKKKFIGHLDFLRQQFNIRQYYNITSENNFPAHCGLASSASSFAALTQCAIKAFGLSNLNTSEIALLSQHGSGSSCRSFFSPWAMWNDSGVQKIDLPYPHLIHQVIVISSQKKAVSSREAHQRVQQSLLYTDRPARAEKRYEELLNGFKALDWEKCYKIVWQEFWDMHSLFHTAENFFSYLLPETISALNTLSAYWQTHHDGPLVTMDAGPNIHLLFREDQAKSAQEIKQHFQEKFLVL